MKKGAKSIAIYCLIFIFIFVTIAFSFDAGSPNRPGPVPKPAPSNQVAVGLVQEKIKNWQNSLFSGCLFKQWISLGDPYLLTADRKPRDIIYQVDTAAIGRGNDALFVRCFTSPFGNCIGPDYIYIKKHPNNMNEIEMRGLWHETIHAILAPHENLVRGVELLYASDPLCNEKAGESYTWYMENMIQSVLDMLERFENEYNKGKNCRDDWLNNNWDMFIKRMTDLRNSGGCGTMGDPQLNQFKSLVGFDVDEKLIKSKYQEIYRAFKDGKFMCPYSFKILRIDAKNAYSNKQPIILTALVAPEYDYVNMKPKVYFAWDFLDDKTEAKKGDGKRIAVTETNLLELTNMIAMRPGTYTIRVSAYQEFVGPKTVVLDKASHTLTVAGEISIQGPSTAAVGDKVSFLVVTNINDASTPELQYAWRMKGSTQIIDNKKSFSKRVDHPGTYEFSVVVYQNDMIKKQSVKLGEAKHTMVVGQGTTVDITGPAQISIGENVPFTANVSKPGTDTGGFAKAAGGIISSIGKELFGKDIMGSGTQAAVQPYIFEWYVDGARTGSTGGSLTHAFAAQGNHTVRVIAYEDIEGKKQKLGEKTVTVTVSEKPSLKGNASITGPNKIKRGETAEFKGNYYGSNAVESTLYFNWIIDGQPMGGSNPIFVPCQSAGQHTIELELWTRIQPKPIRLSKASRILVVEDKKTEQKTSGELTQAEGQAMCDCMNNHIRRTYDKPGAKFVMKPWKYDPKDKMCKGGGHGSTSGGMSGTDFHIGEVRDSYWNNNTGRCK
jgi:hypothetical protein